MIYLTTDVDVIVEEDVAIEDLLESITDKFLIVYNDEVNTFEWVIECFMKVCGHSHVQSEQLAYLIHYKGKATVMSGEIDKLRPVKDSLCEKGLSAVIE